MSDYRQCTRIGIIMAGGSGERFWPLSRLNLPKQLLKLTGTDQTLLEEAVQRLAPLIPRERIFVVTGEHLRDAVREAGLVPAANVWAEPCKRNTAGCLVYAAAQCLVRFGEQADEVSLAVITADHRIGDAAAFVEAMRVALEAAEAEPVLGTIGIAPTRPETGFGYIEVAADATSPGGPLAALPVQRFREKPDRATAEQFLASGHFYWNSGMFFWRLSTFLAELERARPEMAATVRSLAAPLSAGDDAEVRRLFETLDSISVDYALMERARRVVMVPGHFPWDDVGSWDALDRYVSPDANGNAIVGDAVAVDSRNCVVYNEPGAERMAVGVLGVDGLVVVVAEDGVLVLPKDRSQDVRQIVAELKKRGARQV